MNGSYGTLPLLFNVTGHNLQKMLKIISLACIAACVLGHWNHPKQASASDGRLGSIKPWSNPTFRLGDGLASASAAAARNRVVAAIAAANRHAAAATAGRFDGFNNDIMLGRSRHIFGR